MNTSIVSFKKLRSSTFAYFQLHIPNECPYCFKGISPVIATKTEYDEKQNSNVAVLYSCPLCHKYFSREYEVDISFNNSISGYETSLIEYKVIRNVDYSLPDEIDDISTSFREIYTQALIAESENLTSISGIGYRKAIEFLIKDFLINFKETPSETIAKIPLNQAINKIDNERIVHLAKASTWLGNDETHYQRKFVDKDINDMKRFIKALTFYISSEVVALEADEFVNAE